MNNTDRKGGHILPVDGGPARPRRGPRRVLLDRARSSGPCCGAGAASRSSADELAGLERIRDGARRRARRSAARAAARRPRCGRRAGGSTALLADRLLPAALADLAGRSPGRRSEADAASPTGAAEPRWRTIRAGGGDAALERLGRRRRSTRPAAGRRGPPDRSSSGPGHRRATRPSRRSWRPCRPSGSPPDAAPRRSTPRLASATPAARACPTGSPCAPAASGRSPTRSRSPADAADVRGVLDLARARGATLVPYGGGTSVVGGVDVGPRTTPGRHGRPRTGSPGLRGARRGQRPRDVRGRHDRAGRRGRPRRRTA